MEVMVALISHGIDENTIRNIYEQYPIGEKTRDNGDNFFLREMEEAKKYIAENSIAGIKANNTENKKNPDITVYSALDIINRDVDFEFMIDNVWPKGEALMLTGVGGIGKSLMTLQLVMDLVNPPAKGFLDTYKISTTTKHKILFVQSENTSLGIKKRLSIICNPNSGYTISDQVLKESIYFAGTGNDITTTGYIEDSKFRHNLSKNIKNINADIIVVDPLISFHGRDENSNDKMRKVLDILTSFCRDMNVTPLVVHHEGKMENGTDQGGGRGASAIGDWSPNTWKLSKNSKEFIFSAKKARNFELPDDIKLELHYLRFRPFINSSNNERLNLVIQALKDNGRKFDKQSDLLSAMEKILEAQNKDIPSSNTLRSHIKEAVEKGLIKEESNGKNTSYDLKS